MMQYYWHVHHEILCEPLTEPIQTRIDYIKANKPEYEVETRLRLLKPVQHPESLPKEWKEACAKRDEAYAKWDEAYAKWDEANAKCLPEIEKLHKEECPNCPWNGETIFP